MDVKAFLNEIIVRNKWNQKMNHPNKMITHCLNPNSDFDSRVTHCPYFDGEGMPKIDKPN